MLRTYAEIFEKVQLRQRRKRISVAMADDPSVLAALKDVEQKGIAESILIGNPTRIQALAEELHFPVSENQIIPAVNEEEIAALAVEQIRKGRADILMKGHIATPILMKAVLDRDKGLRKGDVLSHVAVAEIPTYPKLLIMGDGGINITPDLETKKAILYNMLQVCQKLQIACPKVAVLCPIEKINPKIPETVDAAELHKLAEAGQFGNIILEGPVATDVALSAEAAAKKGIKSNIAGQTDVLLVPNITCGNAMIKILMCLTESRVGGLVVGATVPIILLSRSDNPEEKFNSILLAILIAD
jgi:phosphate butyryltransferase